MKEKLKKIQARIEQDPKLKEAVSNMKPKKNFWGISGIIFFFFVPELVTYIWQTELTDWAHLHSITESESSMQWLFTQLEEMFRAGVSWFNLVLGSLFLWWALR